MNLIVTAVSNILTSKDLKYCDEFNHSHSTAPRRATYLDFAKISSRPGHLESGFLIQGANKKTAIFAGYIKPRESDVLFGFEKLPFTAL